MHTIIALLFQGKLDSQWFLCTPRDEFFSQLEGNAEILHRKALAYLG